MVVLKNLLQLFFYTCKRQECHFVVLVTTRGQRRLNSFDFSHHVLHPVDKESSSSAIVHQKAWHFHNKRKLSTQNIKFSDLSTEKASESKRKNDKDKKLWQTSKEFNIIILYLVVAFGLHVYIKYVDRKRTKKQVQLEHINQQVQQLYGPLYGNRLVEQKTYRAVMGEHGGLKRYLNQASSNKDGEMIRQWRKFVENVLYPLDKEAEALICQNGHLITDSDFPEAFDTFLTHMAQLKFVMERWKTENGLLESPEEYTEEDFLEKNNASANRGCREMLYHVEKKYKELRKVQKKLKVEIHIEEREGRSLSTMIAKYRKFP